MLGGGNRGLGGLLRPSSWGGSKKRTPGRRLPSGHRPMSANQQCAANGASLLPPAHVRTKHYVRMPTRKKIRQHSHQPPLSSYTSPSSPCLLFLKEKCERGKKRGKECSARGGRWRKPHFFRRAAVSGLLRWL